MLISKQILVSRLILAVCVLNIGACGQTGALVLPEPAPPTTMTPAKPPAATKTTP